LLEDSSDLVDFVDFAGFVGFASLPDSVEGGAGDSGVGVLWLAFSAFLRSFNTLRVSCHRWRLEVADSSDLFSPGFPGVLRLCFGRVLPFLGCSGGLDLPGFFSGWASGWAAGFFSGWAAGFFFFFFSVVVGGSGFVSVLGGDGDGDE
jgi:hypothetical protein